MIELRLTVLEQGRFACADHDSYITAMEHLEPGEILRTQFTRPRSSQENRLFHGVISQAWHNQRGGPRFSDEDGGWERLKHWLLCETGHCDMHVFEPGAISPEVMAFLKADRRDAFWTVNERSGLITLRRAKTVRFADLKHPDFQPIKNKVFELVTSLIVPGTTVEEIMDMVRVKQGGGPCADRSKAA